MDNFSDESWGELGWKARMALCTCAGGGRLLSGRCALNHFWSGESEFPGCKVSCSRAEGRKRNTVVGGLVGELGLPGLGLWRRSGWVTNPILCLEKRSLSYGKHKPSRFFSFFSYDFSTCTVQVLYEYNALVKTDISFLNFSCLL